MEQSLNELNISATTNSIEVNDIQPFHRNVDGRTSLGSFNNSSLLAEVFRNAHATAAETSFEINIGQQEATHADSAVGGSIDGTRSMTKANTVVGNSAVTASNGNQEKSGVEKSVSRKGSLQVRLPKPIMHAHQQPQSAPLHESSSPSFAGFLPNTAVSSGEMMTDDVAQSPRIFLDVTSSSSSAATTRDNTLTSEGNMTKLTKRESYKAQKKNYQLEKKRVANELISMLKDPSIIVLADWLKIRGTLKGWTKLWCVLKPGLVLLYKTPKTHKNNQWVGTVLLSTCELIERPSKKDGFCFKLYHPMEHSIWATRGPSGEAIGAVVQPLPASYLIFRACSESAGKCWMDALELALRCSSLLIRSMSRESKSSAIEVVSPGIAAINSEKLWNESDCEQHFLDHDLEDDQQTDDNREMENDGMNSLKSTDSDSESHEPEVNCDQPLVETLYVESGKEEFGETGDAGQTEEVEDENKSLIWTLVKQVRPGMDLSKVVLPTFILESRSFLDKLTDYYYHSDLVSKAVAEDDPFTRIKIVTQWYLSGFYKKPKGLKKPYNPILGEVFRCYWYHPTTNSRTFYIAEQVSHHPPISAFYVTNRQDGFYITGSILAKSKFYGNSLSAILDGKARLHLLTRGEDYELTMPYAHCKGILLGTLTMEMGGKVTIDCEKTGYSTDIEFKLKPFLGGPESTNVVVGKIRLGKETLATIDGHWDQEIFITDKRTQERQLLWNSSPETKSQRLRRFTVTKTHQENYESEKMWQYVSAAIARCDQVAATEEKTTLEEAQRQAVKERKLNREDWKPRYFDLNIANEWIYKYSDFRPWDPRNDVIQYEYNFVIQTKTRLKTPAVKASSALSVDVMSESQVLGRPLRGSRLMKTNALKRRLRNGDSGSSSHDGELMPCSDSSDSETAVNDKDRLELNREALGNALKPLHESIQKSNEVLYVLQRQLTAELRQQRILHNSFSSRELLIFIVIILTQCFVLWLFK
ncbi:Oxysterol-binding protein- protein 8 [Chamberlinius hualienensis]